MKPASLPTLDKPSGYSTPPGNLACRDPSTTPCPVAIIGARTTRSVDLRPITPQLISLKMKQVCSGRKPPKNVSHVIKTRTASRKLSTLLRNSTMILRNARNQDNVSLPGNSPPAGRESSQSFSHKLMVPFLVMQYSMDEKNDKQGGAFNRES